MTGRRPTGWQVFGATARGASHLRTGLPNQDAIGWTPASAGGAEAALVVSDGHGGKRYIHSHIGSRLSVEAALAEASAILTGDQVDLNGLAARIHRRWMARVNERWDGQSPDHLLEHGATMLAAILAGQKLVVCQIGDGDILIGRRSGTIERALAEDELDGEQTHSLCEAEAPLHARMAMVPVATDDPVDFIMVSSDGLAKSFPDEAAFLDLARHYRGLIAARGLSAVVPELADWLAAASASGSGDDISLGFIVSPDLAIDAAPLTAEPSAAKSQAAPSGDRPPAASTSIDSRSPLPIAGWMLLGALMATGAAVANPWRPWPLLGTPVPASDTQPPAPKPAETTAPPNAEPPAAPAVPEPKP